MSGNCAINFHRYHFNKILVVFRCFGEIEKFYLFLGLSVIFTGPLRVILGILWYSWVNVWTATDLPKYKNNQEVENLALVFYLFDFFSKIKNKIALLRNYGNRPNNYL